MREKGERRRREERDKIPVKRLCVYHMSNLTENWTYLMESLTIPTYFSFRAVETKTILQKKSAKQVEVQGYMLIFPLKRRWISTPQ